MINYKIIILKATLKHDNMILLLNSGVLLKKIMILFIFINQSDYKHHLFSPIFINVKITDRDLKGHYVGLEKKFKVIILICLRVMS